MWFGEEVILHVKLVSDLAPIPKSSPLISMEVEPPKLCVRVSMYFHIV